MKKTAILLACIFVSIAHTSCVPRGLVNEAGKLEATLYGTSYIKVGTEIYDLVAREED